MGQWMTIMTIMRVLVLLNILSFALMRFWWLMTGQLGAKLIFSRRKPTGSQRKLVIYLTEGQAFSAMTFGMIKAELPDWDCAKVRYKSVGWDAKATARAIALETRRRPQVAVFAVGVTDHVARYLEEMPIGNNLKIYAINPCSNRQALRPKRRLCLTVATPILDMTCYLFGWISIIPLIPVVTGNFSLMLMADYYHVMVFDVPPTTVTQTCGVIVRKRPGRYLKQLFHDTSILRVEPQKGTLAASSADFREIQQLLELEPEL